MTEEIKRYGNDEEFDNGYDNDNLDCDEKFQENYTKTWLNYTKSQPTLQKDYIETEAEEIGEQWAAQIAALAVSIPSILIRDGIKKTINYYRARPKTKYEYNSEKKRELPKICKVEKEEPDKIDLSPEIFGKTLFSALETDPVPYLRNYKYNSFKNTLRQVHPRLHTFQNCLRIDLSDQRIGDLNLEKLCEVLPRCPITTLILNGNDLTDKGLIILSKILRSLSRLEDLQLASNYFTDIGIEAIFNKNTYSPTLRSINLAQNILTVNSALYIGSMFKPDCKCSLDSLFLGGKVGRMGWGDDFLRVLVDFLCMSDSRNLRVFSYSEGGLTAAGISTIASLIVCTHSLHTLNISKNPVVDYLAKEHLLNALRINQSIRILYIRQCGLTKYETLMFAEVSKSTTSSTWHESTLLALLTAQELDECTRASYITELNLFNTWQKGSPPPWPVISKDKGEFSIKEDWSYYDKMMRILPSTSAVTLRWAGRMINAIDSLLLCRQVCDEMYEDFENQNKDNKNTNEEVENEISIKIKDVNDYCIIRSKAVHSKHLVMKKLLDSYLSSVMVKKEPIKDVNTKKSKKNKKAENESEGASEGWGKKNKSKVKVDVDTVCMGTEDYYASLIEYSVSLEEYIGKIYKIKLEKEKKILHRIIPYYNSLQLSGCYTHFYYTAWPAEIDRRIKAAIIHEKIEYMRDIKEKRQVERIIANKGSTKKIGKRFEILKKSKVDGAPSELSEQVKELIEKQNADKLARNQKIVRKKIDNGLDVDENVNNTNNSDDDNESDIEEKKIIIRDPTRLLAFKKDWQRLFSEITITEIDIKMALLAYNRGNRRFHVQTLPINLITNGVENKLLFEFETERSDPLLTPSLNFINSTRTLVGKEERLKIREINRKKKLDDLLH